MRRTGIWREQFHEESKGLLGWDQYQGRLWTGFHRNSVLVMLAYSFLVIQEWQQRQQVTLRGRPRGAFSPRADRGGCLCLRCIAASATGSARGRPLDWPAGTTLSRQEDEPCETTRQDLLNGVHPRPISFDLPGGITGVEEPTEPDRLLCYVGVSLDATGGSEVFHGRGSLRIREGQ